MLKPGKWHLYICLGKLLYFTNLNSSAIKGDDSPNPFTIIYGFRSPREVVMKFTQIHELTDHYVIIIHG